MGADFSVVLEEMMQKYPQMKDPAWNTEIFMIVDGACAIAVGHRSGKKVATVIEAPPLCFMMKKLVELLDPFRTHT